jgi:hypothetical protein
MNNDLNRDTENDIESDSLNKLNQNIENRLADVRKLVGEKYKRDKYDIEKLQEEIVNHIGEKCYMLTQFQATFFNGYQKNPSKEDWIAFGKQFGKNVIGLCDELKQGGQIECVISDAMLEKCSKNA